MSAYQRMIEGNNQAYHTYVWLLIRAVLPDESQNLNTLIFKKTIQSFQHIQAIGYPL